MQWLSDEFRWQHWKYVQRLEGRQIKVTIDEKRWSFHDSKQVDSSQFWVIYVGCVPDQGQRLVGFWLVMAHKFWLQRLAVMSAGLWGQWWRDGGCSGLMVQGLLLLLFSMVDSEGIDVGSQGNCTISTKLVRYQLMKQGSGSKIAVK